MVFTRRSSKDVRDALNIPDPGQKRKFSYTFGMSSPKLSRSPLRKISITSRHRPFRILVLGQAGVGKSALTVRFLTRRYIGEYDPTLEKKYTGQTVMDGENITFEVLDTAAQGGESSRLEEHVRWADAYILVYSVTDRCSFEECTRLKFLINHAKKTRRQSHGGSMHSHEPVVALVGNQNDLEHDRMVAPEEGQERARELGCASHFDISVRESYDEARDVFYGLHKSWKLSKVTKDTSSSKDVNLMTPPTLRKRGRSVGLAGHLMEEFSRDSADSSDEKQLLSPDSMGAAFRRKLSASSKKLWKKMVSSGESSD